MTPKRWVFHMADLVPLGVFPLPRASSPSQHPLLPLLFYPALSLSCSRLFCCSFFPARGICVHSQWVSALKWWCATVHRGIMNGATLRSASPSVRIAQRAFDLIAVATYCSLRGNIYTSSRMHACTNQSGSQSINHEVNKQCFFNGIRAYRGF